MPAYGYARVSTTDQDLSLQQEALTRAGCVVIRTEKVSGATRQGRTELRTILDFIGEGDALVVTRVDWLARSIGDLKDIVRELKAKGATLRATEQPIDTSTAAGKAFLDMLGVFAEFETNLRRERQLEGVRDAGEPPLPVPVREPGACIRSLAHRVGPGGSLDHLRRQAALLREVGPGGRARGY